MLGKNTTQVSVFGPSNVPLTWKNSFSVSLPDLNFELQLELDEAGRSASLGRADGPR